jgi:Ca-activated chloride channel family protein
MGKETVRAARLLLSPFWLAIIAVLFMMVLIAAPVRLALAMEPGGDVPPTMTPGEVGTGTLLLRTATPGRYVPAPLIAAEADIRIHGMVARVTVTQSFVNPSDRWLEAVYAFPLPENAAVDRMRLQAGETVIEAKIREREAARQAYRQARQQGHRAALVEQHRPNLFTNAVANIAPGETVSVTLRYQQTVRYDSGSFRLRFPMVAAPRYAPGPAMVVHADGAGWVQQAAPTGDPVPAAPVLRPEAGRINPVLIRVALDAGMPLAALSSAYHRITAEGWQDGTAEIALAEGPAPADRDFELTWTPKTGKAPVAGAFVETIGKDAYVLAMVLPPVRDAAPVPPRDVIFVLDRSGSMAGTSIVQARAAFAEALSRLRPADRFEVIRFSSRTDRLFGGVRRASHAAIARAVAWVNRTKADGGTEMLPALRAALAGQAETGRLRQVVFLTDGAVANETALLAEIEARAGATRLFPVGIGSAPNGYFMTAAAQAGRGSFTYIGALDQVAARTAALFAKLERPAMIDLSAGWTVRAVDAYPKRMPDLYHGEPLLLVAKIPAAEAAGNNAALRLTGNHGGVRWRQALALGGARAAEGIGALWGRARIDALMATLRRGADHAAVRKAVTETALTHGLVSRYTSLVAIADTVTRPETAPAARIRAPLNLPAGWDYDKVFGSAPADRGALQKAAAPRRQAMNAVARFGGGATGAGAGAAMPVVLPQGATGWQAQAALGLALGLAAALLLLMWRRRCG